MQINDSYGIAKLLHAKMHGKDEQAWVVGLKTENSVYLLTEIVTVGDGGDGMKVHVDDQEFRKVLARLKSSGTTEIVLAHSHPTLFDDVEEATPSAADFDLTQVMKKEVEYAGLGFVDALVITAHAVTSIESAQLWSADPEKYMVLQALGMNLSAASVYSAERFIDENKHRNEPLREAVDHRYLDTIRAMREEVERVVHFGHKTPVSPNPDEQ